MAFNSRDQKETGASLAPHPFSGASFQFLPFVVLGIFDGCNPYAITTLLGVVLVLLYWPAGVRAMILAAGVFLLSVLSVNTAVALGFFEDLRRHQIFSSGVFGFYLAAAGGCVLTGMVHLYDWWRLTRQGQEAPCLLKLPERLLLDPSSDSVSKRVQRCLRIVVTAGAAGVLTTLLQSQFSGLAMSDVWEYIFYSPEIRFQGQFGLALYNFMFVFPLGLVFTASIFFLAPQRWNLFLRQYLTTIKIILSALFLSVGLGLLTVLLR